MKKGKWKLVSVVAVLILAGLYYYIALPAINIHATEIWMFMLIVVVLIGADYCWNFDFAYRNLFDWQFVVFANYKCKEISEIIERRDRKIYYRCRRIII